MTQNSSQNFLIFSEITGQHWILKLQRVVRQGETIWPEYSPPPFLEDMFQKLN